MSEGTIPANTGRIPRQLGRVCPDGDHPREYGENWSYKNLLQMDAGPSPRIRGECAGMVDTTKEVGTIPANTGRITS